MLVNIPILLLVGTILFIYFGTTTPQKEQHSMMQTLTQLDNNLTNTIEMMQYSVNQYQFNEGLLQALDTSPNLSQHEAAERINKIRSSLQYQSNILSDCYSKLYLDWNSSLAFLFNDPMICLLQTPEEKSLYTQSINNKDKIIWKGRKQTKIHPFISIYTISGIKSIYSPDNKPLGVLELNIDIQFLNMLFKGLIPSSNSFLVLMDNNCKPITGCWGKNIDPAILFNENTPLKNIQPFLTDASGTMKKKFNGDQAIIAYVVNKKTDWILVNVIPYNEILQNAKVIEFTILIVIIFCILLSICVSIPFSYSISYPIRKLSDAIKSIGDNNFDVTVEYDSNDEVGRLCDFFNRMTKRVNELIEKVYKSEIEKKNAELNTLQAQINPHFLYNNLDTINWLAEMDNNKKIAMMARSLASIFRYSLSRGKNLIPIKDEIALVKNYIQIQNIRFPEQIEVKYIIDPEIEKYKVLKLVLQPLVENSILHGLKGKHQIQITIEVHIQDEDIVIAVSDNGLVPPLDTISYILNGTLTDKGYGIRNVHERIKMFFGKQYGLTYSGNAENGTTVKFHIPLVQNNAN